MQPVPAGETDDSELASLQAEFPQFQISLEATLGRARYVARGVHPGTRPHTLITPDPAELRAVLSLSQRSCGPR